MNTHALGAHTCAHMPLHGGEKATMKIKIYFKVRAFGGEWSCIFSLSSHGWGGGNFPTLGLLPCVGSKGVLWNGGLRGLRLTKCRKTTGHKVIT